MKHHLKAFSVSKPEVGNTMCEDASKYAEHFIAVSDGAGGGGVFADHWAHYLVSQLPESPFTSFNSFSNWMEGIWNAFYDEHESLAQQQGGMFLNKFYDEGSFATLVAAWRVAKDKVKWVAYGDSVVFHYDRVTKKLHHSFSSIANFAQPPHLLNWKEEPVLEGFRSGEFCIEHPSYVFACSDALAFYMMMMYAVSRGEALPLNDDKNSNLMRVAQGRQVDFETDVLKPLLCALKSDALKSHLVSKYRKGLLGLDDYSLARLV